MDEQDWGLTANAPTFSLFKNVSPEEAAAKPGMVDILTYNRWKKHERRIYRKLKTQQIADLVEKRNEEDINDVADLLANQLIFLKSNDDENDPAIDDLISHISSLKVDSEKKHKMETN